MAPSWRRFDVARRQAAGIGVVGVAAPRRRSRRHGGRPKAELERALEVDPLELNPRVYWRITDNWMELTVRSIVGTHQTRAVKDAMSRHIMTELDRAGIGIASATYDIVGMPPLRIERARRAKSPEG